MEYEDCTPFKIGETRRFKESTPSPDFPHLQLVDFQVRMLEASTNYSKFSWKIVVKNSDLSPDAIRGSFSLMDCDGFTLAEDQVKSDGIPGGQETTINGTTTVYGLSSSKVGRFGAGYGGVRSSKKTETVKEITSSFLKPEVRVYYTQLQDTGSGIYFVGEVHNVGSAPARNIKVAFTIKDDRGIDVGNDISLVSPSDLWPGQSGMFRKRVLFLTTSRGYGWFSKAEWSE